MRNIVVCCDGTSNEFGVIRTNVSKLVYCLEQDLNQQLVFYHPGLGTMSPPGALTRTAKAVTRLMGLIAGYGLPSDVRNLYIFLMNEYRAGDKIFLFGFSRGAYVVRALASLIHAYGLVPPGNEPLVGYAVRYMVNAVAHSKAQPEVDQSLALADEFKKTFSNSRSCVIDFVGVWDTVGSIGWFTHPRFLPFTADNASIRVGRHAIALDERRAFFRTNLWQRNAQLSAHGPIDLKQVWFAGSHGDVGGGYAEHDSGLSKISLVWMMREAERHGLLVDESRREEMLGGGSMFAPPAPGSCPHESLNGWWLPLELVPKPQQRTGAWRANLGRRRHVPIDALLHESVLLQPKKYLEDRGLPGTLSIER